MLTEWLKSSPLIIGHRGYCARFPENTLSSFNAAIKAGAQMIELDVTFSKDRRLMVIHDETLDRTTNGTGQIQHHTHQELKQLDAGSWFSEMFSGEKIPDLEEVFDMVQQNCLINVEIKPEAFEISDGTQTIEQMVIQLIEKYHLEESILISSFEHRLFHRIQHRAPYLRLGLLHDPEIHPEMTKLCRHYPVHSCHPDARTLRAEDITSLHEQGLKVCPYTVNNEDEMKKLLSWGVDGMFTDDPVRLLQVIGG
ncbi:MAG: glycerophosphodiester phosphodiesterase [SAR324 cluster bacterium]|nr:glycerophosphodiester phosphodiesterase [SAR324 cluster bacterium]